MALMLGIRVLVSSGLAGAAVAVTHQSTKVTKEKLYKWVGEKFWRRSPDPAATSPSHNSDPIPSTADQLQPQVHNIVDGKLFETRPEERDLAHPVDAARELQPTRPNVVNTVQGDLTAGHVNIDEVELTREAPDLVHTSPALPAVRGESADEPPRSEVVNLRREAPDPTGTPPAVKGKSAAEPTRSVVVNLHREAPDPAGALPAVQGVSAAESPTSEMVNLCGESPDPPPATGFWATVKAWFAGKLNRGVPEPDPPPAMGVWAVVKACIAGNLNWGAPEPDPDGRRVPGPGGRMLDPGIWDKIRRILRKLLWLGVDHLLISQFKRHSVWLQIYRIFKCELS